jgi:hypothetical protein
MFGTVGYGVEPLGQQVAEGPNAGEEIHKLLFIDQQTGETFEIWLSDSACDDLGSKLLGKGVQVATPAEVVQIAGRNGG